MNEDFRKELYRKNVLAGIPRALSLLDRDPFSATYGSFDREYWAWATKDFSNIDLQRAVYPLTLIYLNNFQGNVWYQESRVKDWISAGVKFWQLSQHRDGSFDHHYPNEFSFVGAAFTLYEISQAYTLLDEKSEINSYDKSLWLSSMVKAADFLCQNNELHGFISNHRIGAACALYSMFLITGNEKYRKRAYFFIDSVKEKMSKTEGWLCEYNGFDPGYQTLDTYYLANFYRLSNHDDIFKETIVPSIKILSYFFHPDGSVGGEYGSRNCPLYFPAGFEILAKKLPDAEAISRIGAYAIANGNTPTLLTQDTRNFIPMLSTYTQALMERDTGSENTSTEMPFEREFERFWPESGLFIRSDKRLYSIVGCSKGGVIKVFDKEKKKLIASHAGYFVEFKNNKQYSTQFLAASNEKLRFDCEAEKTPLNEKRKLQLSCAFFSVVPSRFMTPFRFLVFRIFNFTIGRIKLINNLFRKSIIINTFIHRRKKADFEVRRTLIFTKNCLKVIDDFSSLELKRIKSLRSSDIFTTIYMGSSKYYRHSEKIEDELSKENLLEIIKKGNNANIAYEIDVTGLKFIANGLK